MCTAPLGVITQQGAFPQGQLFLNREAIMMKETMSGPIAPCCSNCAAALFQGLVSSVVLWQPSCAPPLHLSSPGCGSFSRGGPQKCLAPGGPFAYIVVPLVQAARPARHEQQHLQCCSCCRLQLAAALQAATPLLL